jgi:hypothetical protein
MTRLLMAALALALLARGVVALDEKEAEKEGLTVRQDVRAVRHHDGPALMDHSLAFVWAGEGIGARLVKGAPYAAEAVTETVQTLGDGNRIVRRTAAEVARDGEGRTRREHVLGAVGPMLAAGDEPRTVFIDDAVAGERYVLNPADKTATRIKVPARGEGARDAEEDVFFTAPLPDPAVAGAGAPREVHKEVRIFRGPGPDVVGDRVMAVKPFQKRLPKGKEESLGRQTVEGVEAEGTRTSFTIPAGEIGNERPIEVVSERWYSPELQVVVLSRHSDPRFGETTYRLTRLARGEPDRSLFEVPADYKVEEASPGRRVMKFKREHAPAKP